MKNLCSKKFLAIILLILETAIIYTGIRNAPSEKNPSSMSSPETTIQHSSNKNEETLKFLFGNWNVTKLIGFTKIQNDYTNYPDGHDIIGNQILISKKRFSTKGIRKYERYQSDMLDPTYSISCIYSKYELLICPIDTIEADSEINTMIKNASFQSLEITNTVHPYAPVQLFITNDNHLILELDGAFYLLKKEQS